MNDQQRPLRFGLIGCGGMGAGHALNVHYIEGMEIAAYVDVAKERADRFLENLGGDYATDDSDRVIADDSIDGVLLVTGEEHHPRLGIAAAGAGKHVFMEKPVAVTMEEAMEVRAVLKDSPVKYQNGMCNRLAPMVRKAKEALPNPWITFGQCTDLVSGQACHNLDLICHLFHQAPLETVYATGGHYYGFDEHLPADSFTSILKFADGSQATYIQHGQAYNNTLRKYSFQLFGKDRCVYLANRFMRCIVSSGLGGDDYEYAFHGREGGIKDVEKVKDHENDPQGPYGYMGHYEELIELRDAIRNDTTPTMTIDHGVNVLAVEKAIFESITTGEIVKYPEFIARWGFEQPFG